MASISAGPVQEAGFGNIYTRLKTLEDQISNLIECIGKESKKINKSDDNIWELQKSLNRLEEWQSQYQGQQEVKYKEQQEAKKEYTPDPKKWTKISDFPGLEYKLYKDDANLSNDYVVWWSTEKKRWAVNLPHNWLHSSYSTLEEACKFVESQYKESKKQEYRPDSKWENRSIALLPFDYYWKWYNVHNIYDYTGESYNFRAWTPLRHEFIETFDTLKEAIEYCEAHYKKSQEPEYNMQSPDFFKLEEEPSDNCKHMVSITGNHSYQINISCKNTVHNIDLIIKVLTEQRELLIKDLQAEE